MDEAIWGRNAVLEAMRAGRTINKLLIARGAHGKAQGIMAQAREARYRCTRDRDVLDRLAAAPVIRGSSPT